MAKKKVQHSHKKRKLWISIALIIIVLATIKIAYFSSITPKTQAPTTTTTDSLQPHSFDFGNQKMRVNNQELAFVNHIYETSNEADGKHSAIISNQTANPSQTKSAAILIDNPGGSGTFYYVVGASVKDGKEIYSKPVLIGDRIKILSVSVADAGAEDNGIITVKYLDRSTGTPMATEPTQEKTTQYAFENNGNLIVVLH